MWAVSGNNHLVKESWEQKNSQMISSKLRHMNSSATQEYYLCIPLPAPASVLKGDGDSCSHCSWVESSPEASLGVDNRGCSGTCAILGCDLLARAVRLQWSLCVPSNSRYSIILWYCSCQDNGGSSFHHHSSREPTAKLESPVIIYLSPQTASRARR